MGACLSRDTTTSIPINSEKPKNYGSSDNNGSGTLTSTSPAPLPRQSPHRKNCNKKCLTRKKCITGWIPYIMHSLSLLTCQYIRPNKSTNETRRHCITTFMIVLIALSALFTITISIIPTSAFLAGWIECPYGIYNICSTVEQHDGTPIVVLKDTNHTITEPSFINIKNKIEVEEFLDLSKIAILFSTTASGVSQVFFFWALWCLFIKHYKWPDNKCGTEGWKELKSFFCCIRDNDHDSTKPLDPFDDDVENEVFEPSSIVEVYQHRKKYYYPQNKDDLESGKEKVAYFEAQDELTNTPLQGERLCHYIVLFAIAIILLIITVSLFFDAQYVGASEDVLDEKSFKWESAAVAFHAYSLFRILVSCFIFSKLMYGIQRKCEELEMFILYVDDHYNELPQESNNVYKYVKTLFDNVLEKLEREKPDKISQQDDGNEVIVDSYTCIINKIKKEKTKTVGNKETNTVGDEEALALKYLNERDKHFIKQAVATLSWLQLWFLLHWLLHIISTFMTMALFVDAIALRVRAEVPHKQGGFDFHPVEIGFLFTYSLMQCFFLFYPCLRAASVTRTRQRVIDKISENICSFENIPCKVVKKFIDSMKRRRFGFQLRIFCAQMPFNMNIAYLSIAFGFVGIILSLITSVSK